MKSFERGFIWESLPICNVADMEESRHQKVWVWPGDLPGGS